MKPQKFELVESCIYDQDCKVEVAEIDTIPTTFVMLALIARSKNGNDLDPYKILYMPENPASPIFSCEKIHDAKMYKAVYLNVKTSKYVMLNGFIIDGDAANKFEETCKSPLMQLFSHDFWLHLCLFAPKQRDDAYSQEVKILLQYSNTEDCFFVTDPMLGSLIMRSDSNPPTNEMKIKFNNIVNEKQYSDQNLPFKNKELIIE